jgi:eukaryotic-like serine/threonine-protein kinase
MTPYSILTTDKNMFKSITNRPLWVNILAAFILAVVIVLLFFLSLKWLTHHDTSRTVPSVAGKKFEEAKNILEKNGFEIVIQDSVYVDTLPPTGIIRQVPDADAVVKVNRTVYLTINRTVPPMIEMPNLVGYSFRNAEMVLKNMGLRMGDTTFKADFAKNSVLEQRYDGRSIAPGTKLRQGSEISLVLGNGVGQYEFAVPVLVGLTLNQAKTLLESNGINIGAVVADNDVTDTMNAWIYWQNPSRFDEDRKLQHIRSGQMMDVRVSVNRPAVDSTKAPTPELEEN